MDLHAASFTPQADKVGAAGEVEASFNTTRHTTNLSDNNRPFSEKNGSREGMEASPGMIESMKRFIVRENVKALMSMREAWKRAFNARGGQL